jgi:hypothetical protein
MTLDWLCVERYHFILDCAVSSWGMLMDDGNTRWLHELVEHVSLSTTSVGMMKESHGKCQPSPPRDALALCTFLSPRAVATSQTPSYFPSFSSAIPDHQHS